MLSLYRESLGLQVSYLSLLTLVLVWTIQALGGASHPGEPQVNAFSRKVGRHCESGIVSVRSVSLDSEALPGYLTRHDNVVPRG